MSDSNTSNAKNTEPEQQAERFTTPSAGPEPTADEIAAADRSADEVDLDEVAKHEEEMNHLGATVKGEGEIEPSS